MRSRYVLALLAVLALAIAGCGGGDGDDESTTVEETTAAQETTTAGDDSGGSSLPETIKIGVQLDLAGESAGDLSKRSLNAMELAVEHVAERGLLGDSEIELVVEDTEGKPENYPIAYGRLIDEGVSAIAGGVFSDGVAAVHDTVEEAQIPAVVTTTIAPGVEEGDFWFRVSTPSSELISRSVPEIVKHFGVKKVGELWQQDSTTTKDAHGSFQAAFEAEGVSYADQTMTKNDHEFANQLDALMKSGMDLFVPNSDAGLLPPMIIQARQRGFDGNVYSHVGLQSQDVVDQCKEACYGATFAAPWDISSDDPGIQAFVQSYEEKYGSPPDVYAAQAYEAIMLIAEGIKAAGSADPVAVRDGIASVKTMNGAMGPGEQNEEGAMVYTPVIIEITEEGFKPLALK